MAKAKPKKKIEAVVKDDAIAIVTPIIGDRYKPSYEKWNDFVNEQIPEDKYPEMHKSYLSK